MSETYVDERKRLFEKAMKDLRSNEVRTFRSRLALLNPDEIFQLRTELRELDTLIAACLSALDTYD